jgi:hypothetical protein
MSASCACCARPIAGDSGDVVVCVVDPADGPLTLCAPCYAKDPRRVGWTEWRAPSGPSARAMLAEFGP